MSASNLAGATGRRLLLGYGLALLLSGCASPPRGHDDGAGRAGAPVPAPFVELSAAAGLDFRHDNGMIGERHFCEVMGPGAALFDYDNDGDLDVYLVQGQPLAPGADPGPGDRLFRNRLEMGTLTFEDVTGTSGLDARGYGMGVATGDFDNDGFVDLYVTNFGANQLWRNRGDGTFEDVTEPTGTGDARWSTSAAWLDLDADGWLDLYVVNYVDFQLAANKVCRGPSGLPDYCNPQSYEPEPDRLLRNLGPGVDGLPRFEDISGPAGLLRAPGTGLGVVTGDFDGDGRVDLYVANDLMRNRLWRNEGGGALTDTALLAGAAVNLAGQAEASMGVAVGDLDADGDDDLFVSHLRSETNTFYRNDGGTFFDATALVGLATPSLGATGFGTAFLDIELDGWLDLVVVNGAVTYLEEQLRAGDPYPLAQPNQLFRNRGDGVLQPHDNPSDAVWQQAEVSRGLAVGDLDNDGDDDLVVINNQGPARVLINQAADGAGWIGIRAVGDGRDQLGARIAVVEARPAAATVRTDGSYLSASDPRRRFAFAGTEATVEIRWPTGETERWTGVPARRYTTLIRGTGTPVEAP